MDKEISIIFQFKNDKEIKNTIAISQINNSTFLKNIYEIDNCIPKEGFIIDLSDTYIKNPEYVVTTIGRILEHIEIMSHEPDFKSKNNMLFLYKDIELDHIIGTDLMNLSDLAIVLNYMSIDFAYPYVCRKIARLIRMKIPNDFLYQRSDMSS